MENKDAQKQKIEKKNITDELRESYLDYAMSVIVSRALPDVRDGLKPVHRRILWAMWDDGLTHNAKFRKSANVVGSVLGRYHPHGDAAVYDAMVRMAQDFSLRYPLIQGQGNFGCFTKDTKVKLTDGRDLSFEELIKEDELGKNNYTYTINSTGLISIAKIKNPRLTKKNAKIIKIILDNGQEIKCTPNHLFMLKDGSYKESQNLTPQDSLMPLYQKLSEKTDRLNREGYVLIYQPQKDEWTPAHHLADNHNLTIKKYANNAGRIRHHIDFNKFNNNPENIIRMRWGEHWKVHYKHASEQHKNPDYREKIAAGRQKYLSDPAVKEKYRKILHKRNIENWRNPKYREKMRRFLSEINKKFIQKHPEKRIELSERATKTLNRLWQNPEYRAFMREKIIKGNKNRKTNRTGKLKFVNVCKEILNQQLEINEINYNEIKNKIYPYGKAALWRNGLNKYFQNNPDLIRQEINANHKIVKIENLSETVDVYDLTIDKTHNFCLGAGIFVHNSVDGDSAAAMRYTESRLSKIAEEMLVDIEKETVDWQLNYDATRQEPKVLPAKLPNLLLNGVSGIAVGMATSVPPHNLNEVVDAAAHLIDNPKSTTEDLMRFVQGPDFPTGGIIYGKKSITEAYAGGRGPITIRAKTEIQERGKEQMLIISEIPYQVNKSELIIKIADLAREKKIEGIKDIRDESDREGMRIVIEIKSGASPQKILNALFKHTDLQKDFHLNMIALANGIQPQLMTLKDILAAFISHRQEVVKKRAEFELKKAKERAHILEGLVKALSIIDQIIATIKKSKNTEEAHQKLVKNFKLTDIQAAAILEMKLRALAALERQKLEDELNEKKKLIKDLEDLLKSPSKILGVIKNEFLELKENYGGERKTQIVSAGLKEFKEEDLIPSEEAVITLTSGGYIKRVSPDIFKAQRRGGKGLIGSEVGEEDFITHFISANTHDNVLFFTEKGKVFQTKAYEIPAGSRTAKGKLIQNFLDIPAEEKISAIVAYATTNDQRPTPKQSKLATGQATNGYLVMATKNGIIKKTPLEDFGNVRKSGIIALNLKADDRLKWAGLSSGKDEIIIATSFGQAIRFKESQLRPMGRTASGVRAIKLKKDDFVAGIDIIKKDRQPATGNQRLLVVMENGFAKQTPLKEYRMQSRGGSGIKTAKITAKTGKIVSAKIIDEQEELLALSIKGQIIRTEIKSVRIAGRATSGVKIMRLKEGDKVAGVVAL